VIKDKAVKLSEVMGGNAELYYQICDVYGYVTVNDLIEMLLTDPSLLQKYSSFKWKMKFINNNLIYKSRFKMINLDWSSIYDISSL